MDDLILKQLVDKQWDIYRQTDRREKLDLLRHSFSMYIPHADRVYEDLHIALDDREELKYPLNKAAVIGDDYSLKGFARFLFALKEDETKTFTWVTADGRKEWILSRGDAVLYVNIPEYEEGFFIRYIDFRDECFAAYEKRYGWGYNAEIQKIEVPATDYDFLKTLDVQNEFELVRFFDDGVSFETTDADRLLRYIDEQKQKEKSSEEPDEARLRSFRDLHTAIWYFVTEQKRLRRVKKLRPATGIDLSRLKDNWEECDFRYNVSMDPDDWHDAVYRRYGDLPDGRHFGVYIWPKSEAWPPESAMMIVSETGEMQTNTVMDDRWDVHDANRWPLAAVATPSGKSILWLKDGRIWVWREDWLRDKQDICFQQDDGEELTDRIEGVPVYDALMRDDGILVLFQEGKRYAYLCDEDIVLVRNEDEGCWIPANKAESPCRNELFPAHVNDWPDEFAVMIRAEDDEGDYYSCGIRRVCFEPGLEVIKFEILADNPDLESVTIPASVKEVQTWAFGCCTNLKNLVIEGDPSRVTNWAPDAFDACACEEEYLRLRNENR